MLLGTFWNNQERPLYIVVFLHISRYILCFRGAASALKSLGSDPVPVQIRSAAPAPWVGANCNIRQGTAGCLSEYAAAERSANSAALQKGDRHGGGGGSVGVRVGAAEGGRSGAGAGRPANSAAVKKAARQGRTAVCSGACQLSEEAAASERDASFRR